MRLFDYRQSSESDKNKWLNTFQITSGLKYFGGKTEIGKNLMHRICNMAERMDMDGKHADIFIDGFTGGGKLGLSVPEGWFDLVVMNDLNYGIVSYFRCCKERPEALFQMIKLLGSVMSEDMYYFYAFHRSNNGKTSEKDRAKEFIDLVENVINKGNKDIDNWVYVTREDREGELRNIEELFETKNKNEKKRYYISKNNLPYLSSKKVHELVSGAMTYWVTQLEFLGMTDPYKVSYVADVIDNKTYNMAGASEKERIENAIKHANKVIKNVHNKMKRNNIIVENLDYRELIKKYNGKPYVDAYGNHYEADGRFSSKNKLWYFDPPYHPSTLYAGMEAPYEDKFTWALASEMVKILSGSSELVEGQDKSYLDTYGELEYFIKSDYDPKTQYKSYVNQRERAEKKFYDAIKISKNMLNDADVQKLMRKLERGEDIAETDFKNIITKEDNTTSKKNIIKIMFYWIRICKQIEYVKAAYHDFDVLEENIDILNPNTGEVIKPKKEKPVYYKLKLGEYRKGVRYDELGKTVGIEYVWCRGNYLPEDDK